MLKKYKAAFYPCGADDIEEPMCMLKSLVDKFYFCDISSAPKRKIKQFENRKPKPIFIQGNVREQINNIKDIDVLFYRRDTAGEGGSGIFVLGDSFLWKILDRFNASGGLIITDGSNSRGGLYKKMKRESGLKKNSWHIFKSKDQLFLEEHGLYTFDVLPMNV